MEFHGANPSSFQISQNIPGLPQAGNPFIPVQANNLGDTVYYLLSSVYDPRTVVDNQGNDRYSVIGAGFDYTTIAKDFLLRQFFEKRPGRQEPAENILNDIIDTIADVSRMLGIYLTALTMKQSRDPEMFQRARELDLHNTFDEMQTILTYLPCPKAVVQANMKYVRLMDVASNDLYQNIGFLVAGDYDAFVQLYAAVRARRTALSWMRILYPELGSLGDPGSAGNPDVLEAFINAQVRNTAAGGYAVHTTIGGSTGEVSALQSGGILSTIVEGGNRYYTTTGWAVPGSGFGSTGVIRVPVSSLCRWDGDSDATICRIGGSGTINITGTSVTPERVLDAPLAANLGHEYNIATSEGSTSPIVKRFDTGTGEFFNQGDALTAEDPRYRVSAGFSLGALSYKLDANIMTTQYMMTA